MDSGAAHSLLPVSRRSRGATADGLLAFVLLAWGSTWLLSLPVVWSTVHGVAPPPLALALAALSAFGPSGAALVVAKRQGRSGELLARFRARSPWLMAGLLTPLGLHLTAKLIECGLGGTISRWFWLPRNGAQVAALILFSLGEELGWRGFAHPRLLRRYGPVLGPLATGLIWGIWHLFYAITPQGSIELAGFLLQLLEFTLWAPVIAWFFERSGRSLAVAISLHAGGHLDNAAQLPPGAGRLRVLLLLVLGTAACLALRSLRGAWQADREGRPARAA